MEIIEEGTEIEALSRSIKDRFKEYVRLNKRLPDEVLLSVLNLDEIGRMTDSISAYILGKVPLKQELLAEPSLAKRNEQCLLDTRWSFRQHSGRTVGTQ